MADRARTYGSISALVAVVLFVLAGVLLYSFVAGYKITSPINPLGQSNPLLKTAATAPAHGSPIMPLRGLLAAPAIGIVGMLAAGWRCG